MLIKDRGKAGRWVGKQRGAFCRVGSLAQREGMLHDSRTAVLVKETQVLRLLPVSF